MSGHIALVSKLARKAARNADLSFAHTAAPRSVQFVVRNGIQSLARRAAPFFALFFARILGICLLSVAMSISWIWGGNTCVSTAQAAPDPADLLRRFRDNTAGTRTLMTLFQQQKTLALMAETLDAEGRMCVQQTPQGLSLLWEYTAPSVSGFVYDEHGTLRLWLRDRTAIRPATDNESGLLRAMSEQILSWLRTNPELLARTYHLEWLPPTPVATPVATPAATSAATSSTIAAGAAPAEQVWPHGVGLVPKRNNVFFSRLEVRFDPAVTRLHSLRLVEKEGDATLLLFSGELRNAPLPDFCQP